jgi:undecaprenyl-diphosphatase
MEILDWGAFYGLDQLRDEVPALTKIAQFMIVLGSYRVLAAILLVVIVWLQWKRQIRTALFVVAVVVGSAALVELIKLAIGRARPRVGAGHLSTPLSFPSEQAFVSIVLFGAIAWLLTRSMTGVVKKWLVYLGVIYLILMMGACQLLLGAHFLSDVLAGWAGGLALLLASLNLAPAEDGPGSLPISSAAASKR